MIQTIEIRPNPNGQKDKKRFIATFTMGDGKIKTTKFGLWKPPQDWNTTTFYDGATPEKRKAYIARHSGMSEDWTKDGITTAGYLSRWVLWEFSDINNIKKKLRKDSGVRKIVLDLTPKYKGKKT